jgi:predicted transcriptional regulator
MSIPTARDLMTDRVLAARADWSLQELASFFTEHSISGAPVVSEYGSAIGVVSLTDIARHNSQPPPASEEGEEKPPAYFLGDAVTLREEETLHDLRKNPQTSVKDIMMPAIFTVEKDAPIHEVADRMVRGHLHRLLVVQPGTKRDVVGIVSAIDLLEWIRDQKDTNAAQ